jgi:cyclophilin family peptidyl-prolyl cis-trans isomerase
MSNPTATLSTSLGDIKIELLADQMPITAGNFVKLAKSGFYDGGTLSMANKGPQSGSCQFFINVVDNPYLDWFSPGPSKHPVFGKVIEGMDVIDKISKTPRDGGDRPKTPVKMLKVSVSES